MKIIMGLGNPGEQYASTRHNSGMLLVDAIFNFQFSIFNESYGWRRKKNIMVAEFPELILVKTAGYFMNESGGVIREMQDTRYKMQDLENFYLAHDDLDLRLGEYKIQFGKGPKEHNGVESVENQLKTKEFWRIRVGIDNRQATIPKSQIPSNNQISNSKIQRISGEEYVLQRFSGEEKEVLNKVLDKIAHEIIETNIGR